MIIKDGTGELVHIVQFNHDRLKGCRVGYYVWKLQPSSRNNKWVIEKKI